MPKTRRSRGQTSVASTVDPHTRRGRPTARGGGVTVVPDVPPSLLPVPSTSTSVAGSTATTDAPFMSPSAVTEVLAAIREEVRQELFRQTAISQQPTPGSDSGTSGQSRLTGTPPVSTAPSAAVAGPFPAGRCAVCV